MTRIKAKRGYEVWVHFDTSAGVFECFASESGEDYLGCFDTIEAARRFAAKWIEDSIRGN